MIERPLPDGHVWLRVVKPSYADPFDMSYAQEQGGRWNPPRSWPTLYVNEDMPTVHAQVLHMFLDRGIHPDDLDDDAPILLAAAVLPEGQQVADVVSEAGVEALGLPPTYPVDHAGQFVEHPTTQAVGVRVHDAGLQGVWSRSAAGTGTEVAWFPVGQATAHRAWPSPLPYGAWRHAAALGDVVVA